MGQETCFQRVAALLRVYGVAQGSRLLAGVSGGPDSVALLHVLRCLRQQGAVGVVYAAHMNHGIRAEQADADAAFVRLLCASWDVPLFEECADVPALSKKEGMTLEEAARSARYAFLRRMKENWGAHFVVTAHHMDDQAETVLLHLLRGSGLTGLCGMQVCAGDVLRPFLTTTRQEILDYIAQEGLSYRTDETNLEPGCMRNRIRLELLPRLKRDYNPSITEGLCRMAGLLQEDEVYLNAQAERALERAALSNGGYARAQLALLEMPIQSRAVRIALERVGALYDMQLGGIQSVCTLLHANTGAHMALPRGVQARISYDTLFIERPEHLLSDEFETPLVWPGETKTPVGRFCAQLSQAWRTDEGANVAYLDTASLPQGIVVRRRRPGDRFQPLGAAGSRKFKEYLIDKKIPRERRERPILAAEQEVIYFPGGTISHKVRVREDTVQILRVEYLPN